MCATRPSTYSISIVVVVHSLLIIWLFTVCLSCYCSNCRISFCLYYCLLYHEKSTLCTPSCQGLEGAPCTSATCNAISDKRRCDFKISHGEIVSMDHSLHYFYLFLSHFVHFSSIKNMLYCKEISAEQNAGHVQLCHYFIWQVMTACLINVVIDKWLLVLMLYCSLEAANCTM